MPLVRVPSAERETGGVAVDVVGAGEIARAADARPRTGGSVGARRRRRRPRVAVDDRVSPPAAGRHRARSLTVTVVRYTPQAVLIANVEEARYRALAAEDGRLLVEARYAVRNNQRSFLKVTMPAGSTLWSARWPAGRCGPAWRRQDAVLLPLEKGPRRRGGADLRRRARLPAGDRARGPTKGARASTCRRSICRSRAPGWSSTTRRGSASTPQPGAFRARRPIPVRSRKRLRRPRRRRPPPTTATPQRDHARRRRTAGAGRSASGTRRAAARSSARCRCTSTFPAFGPSMFLASELTAEARSPLVELTVKREKRDTALQAARMYAVRSIRTTAIRHRHELRRTRLEWSSLLAAS